MPSSFLFPTSSLNSERRIRATCDTDCNFVAVLRMSMTGNGSTGDEDMSHELAEEWYYFPHLCELVLSSEWREEQRPWKQQTTSWNLLPGARIIQMTPTILPQRVL